MFSAGGSKYVVLQAMLLDACHSSAHVAISPDVMQKQVGLLIHLLVTLVLACEGVL
jgi:hypothetical protein